MVYKDVSERLEGTGVKEDAGAPRFLKGHLRAKVVNAQPMS